MDFGRMDARGGSWRFHAAPRKLLVSPAPSPVANSSYVCRDLKTGNVVSCQNPHTLVIIVAGMACMVFLVTVALLLLCWSVVRQRRLERLRRESGAADETSSSPAPDAATRAAPVDSPEFDDAVLVQLPGDEKPQLFALPKPFLADAPAVQEPKTPDEVVAKCEEKESCDDNPAPLTVPDSVNPSSGNQASLNPASVNPSSGDSVAINPSSEDDPARPGVEDASVPSAGGRFHNPLFAPR